MVGRMPMVKVPNKECFSSSTVSLSFRARSNTFHACSTMLLPIGVGEMGWLFRSNILIPSSSSNFCTIELNVGWVTLQYSAALAKCLKRYTAMTYSSCCSVIITMNWLKINNSYKANR